MDSTSIYFNGTNIVDAYDQRFVTQFETVAGAVFKINLDHIIKYLSQVSPVTWSVDLRCVDNERECVFEITFCIIFPPVLGGRCQMICVRVRPTQVFQVTNFSVTPSSMKFSVGLWRKRGFWHPSHVQSTIRRYFTTIMFGKVKFMA